MIRRMKKGTVPTRVSVPVPDRVRSAVAIQTSSICRRARSAASIYERLLEYGYDAAVRAKRHREQLASALAYERDPERRRIAADLQRASLQHGVI